MKVELGQIRFFRVDGTSAYFQVSDVAGEHCEIFWLKGYHAGDTWDALTGIIENTPIVPIEQIELFFDETAGRERAVIVPDAFKAETIEGDYLELSNGIWLRSLKDGRYIDDYTKCIWAPTYKRTDGATVDDYEYEYTGRYVQLFMNRSMRGSMRG